MVNDEQQEPKLTPESAKALADSMIDSHVIPKKVPHAEDVDGQIKAVGGALASALLTATEIPLHMLQPVVGLEGAGYWLAVVYIVVKAVLAMALWGAAAIGYVYAPLVWWERLLAAGAAAFLVAAVPLTDEIGFALSLVAIALHLYRSRGYEASRRST